MKKFLLSIIPNIVVYFFIFLFFYIISKQIRKNETDEKKNTTNNNTNLNNNIISNNIKSKENPIENEILFKEVSAERYLCLVGFILFFILTIVLLINTLPLAITNKNNWGIGIYIFIFLLYIFFIFITGICLYEFIKSFGNITYYKDKKIFKTNYIFNKKDYNIFEITKVKYSDINGAYIFYNSQKKIFEISFSNTNVDKVLFILEDNKIPFEKNNEI